MVDSGWTTGTGTEGDFATLPLCHFAALRGVLLQPQAPSLLLGLRAPHTHRHTQALRAASLAPRVFIVSAARACAACPLVSSLPESSSLRPSSSAWCLGLRVSERGTRVCVGACRWRVGLRTFRGRRARFRWRQQQQHRRCVYAAYSLFLLPRSLSRALVLPRRIACLASCLRLSWPWRQPFLFGRAHRAPPLPPAPPPAPPLRHRDGSRRWRRVGGAPDARLEPR